MTPEDIQRGTDQPVYVQLANLLRNHILSGAIPPRRPLPSKTTLKQELGVADGTINKAIAILREEGMVRTVQGLGVFVTERGEWVRPPKSR